MNGWWVLLLIVPLLLIPRRRRRGGWCGERVRADLQLGSMGSLRARRGFGAGPFEGSGAFGRVGRPE